MQKAAHKHTPTLQCYYVCGNLTFVVIHCAMSAEMNLACYLLAHLLLDSNGENSED